MDNNKVYNKILKFALPEITFSQFYAFLMESTPSNPIFVKSDKVSGGTFARDVYWGPFLMVLLEVLSTITKQKIIWLYNRKIMVVIGEQLIYNQYQSVHGKDRDIELDNIISNISSKNIFTNTNFFS
jgi:hypothetical protein